MIIFSKSKEDYIKNIFGFGKRCAEHSHIYLKKDFQKYAIADPYNLELKPMNILVHRDKNFMVFETRRGEIFIAEIIRYSIQGIQPVE